MCYVSCRPAVFPLPLDPDPGHPGPSSAGLAQPSPGRHFAPLASTHFRLIPRTAQPTRRWRCCRALSGLLCPGVPAPELRHGTPFAFSCTRRAGPRWPARAGHARCCR
ncbi:MAG: hypothetical protein C0449_16385 [Polaromonas sp.]|nr:hypothetical protein [Polaromonas sp.]